jgi:hypothetical protein
MAPAVPKPGSLPKLPQTIFNIEVQSKQGSTMSKTVPVGVTTQVGAALAALQFIGALVLYLSGDHTAASQTAVEVGASGVLTSLAVIAGRYFQAHKQIGADLEQVEHGLGLTTAQVEALVEQKLPELLPGLLGKIKIDGPSRTIVGQTRPASTASATPPPLPTGGFATSGVVQLEGNVFNAAGEPIGIYRMVDGRMVMTPAGQDPAAKQPGASA